MYCTINDEEKNNTRISTGIEQKILIKKSPGYPAENGDTSFDVQLNYIEFLNTINLVNNYHHLIKVQFYVFCTARRCVEYCRLARAPILVLLIRKNIRKQKNKALKRDKNTAFRLLIKIKRASSVRFCNFRNHNCFCVYLRALATPFARVYIQL